MFGTFIFMIFKGMFTSGVVIAEVKVNKFINLSLSCYFVHN